jgi:hypothetical protein
VAEKRLFERLLDRGERGVDKGEARPTGAEATARKVHLPWFNGVPQGGGERFQLDSTVNVKEEVVLFTAQAAGQSRDLFGPAVS